LRISPLKIVSSNSSFNVNKSENYMMKPSHQREHTHIVIDGRRLSIILEDPCIKALTKDKLDLGKTLHGKWEESGNGKLDKGADIKRLALRN
jgi:hypothetical protein